MPPAAIRRLDVMLSRDMTVLELGAGSSTPWLVARVKYVTSLEPDAKWAETVRRQTSLATNLTLLSQGLMKSLGELSNQTFDCIIIDHHPIAELSRPQAFERLQSQAKSVIVLDDSDCPWNRVQPNEDEWSVERCIGMKSVPLAVVETSIFQRKEPLG